MREKCHGCAFTEGTDANRTQMTTLLAEACVISGELFYCHVDQRVCRGWAAECEARGEQPQWRREAAKIVADAINAVGLAAEAGIHIPTEDIMTDVIARIEAIGGDGDEEE